MAKHLRIAFIGTIFILTAIFVLAISFVLIVYNAAAATPTPWAPTGTTEWEPIFVTATPAPPSNYACPSGMPGGWGTVTPNPWWSANCSNCLLTQTPQATTSGTPGTGTPGSPTPTQGTPMPTPTYTIGDKLGQDCDYLENNGTTTQCESGGEKIKYSYNDGSYNSGLYRSIKIVQKIECMPGETCGSSTANFDIDYQMHCVISWSGSTATSIALQTKFQIYGQTVTTNENTCYNTTTCTLENDYNGTQNMTRSDDQFLASAFAGPSGTIRSGTYSSVCFITTSRTDYATPTPYPTFTPTPGAYSECEDVNGGDDDPGSGFGELPIPRVGAGVCITIPGFDGELSGLSWIPGLGDWIEQINFPGLQLCAVPIRFGELGLFGLTINLDLFALIFAAALVMRIILRS